MLYFAYGSNMDPTQMEARCPSAKAMGFACLEGHVLCFPRRSKNRNCGVSSIEPRAGHETWGVVYEVSDADLFALDKNEGYRPDRNPAENAYNRIFLTVNLGGKPIEVETYVAVPQEGSHLPNAAYLRHLRDGVAHHLLPEAYCVFLAGLEGDQSQEIAAD